MNTAKHYKRLQQVILFLVFTNSWGCFEPATDIAEPSMDISEPATDIAEPAMDNRNSLTRPSGIGQVCTASTSNESTQKGIYQGEQKRLSQRDIHTIDQSIRLLFLEIIYQLASPKNETNIQDAIDHEDSFLQECSIELDPCIFARDSYFTSPFTDTMRARQKVVEEGLKSESMKKEIKKLETILYPEILDFNKFPSHNTVPLLSPLNIKSIKRMTSNANRLGLLTCSTYLFSILCKAVSKNSNVYNTVKQTIKSTIINQVLENARQENKINQIDQNGFTPLHWSIGIQDPFLFDRLIKHGADCNVHGKNNINPVIFWKTMVYATNYNKDTLIKVGQSLIEQSGFKIDTVIEKDQEYAYTLVHKAAQEDNVPQLQLLLQLHKNSSLGKYFLQEQKFLTLLHLAGPKATAHLLKYMEEYNIKININAQNSIGSTPLHEAVKETSDHKVKILLKYGADPTIQNKNNVTPLHLALTKCSTHPFYRYCDTSCTEQENKINIIIELLKCERNTVFSEKPYLYIQNVCKTRAFYTNIQEKMPSYLQKSKQWISFVEYVCSRHIFPNEQERYRMHQALLGNISPKIANPQTVKTTRTFFPPSPSQVPQKQTFQKLEQASQLFRGLQNMRSFQGFEGFCNIPPRIANPQTVKTTSIFFPPSASADELGKKLNKRMKASL